MQFPSSESWHPSKICLLWSFTLQSLQVIFISFGFFPEFIAFCGKVNITGVWCFLGHVGSDTLRFTFTFGLTSLQSFIKCASWNRRKQSQGFGGHHPRGTDHHVRHLIKINKEGSGSAFCVLWSLGSENSWAWQRERCRSALCHSSPGLWQ